GRLAAAGLSLGKVHAQAFALQQADGVQAGFGEEQVDHAGAEQVDLLRFGRIPARRGQRRRHAGGVGGCVVEEVAHRLYLRVGPVGMMKNAESAARGAADSHESYRPTRGSLTPSARSEEHTSELQSRENLVCR